MAQVSINITRGNGMNVSTTGEVPDEYIIEITSMLAAMLFDAAVTPAAEDTGDSDTDGKP